jgi:hypothetical protein
MDAERFSWQRWIRWREGDPRWRFEVLDASALSASDTCAWLSDWADRQLRMLEAGELPLSGRWWER